MDRDAKVLEELSRSVTLIDKKYRRASPAERITLKKSRDDAFNAYREARVKLLEGSVLATAADVRRMKEIRVAIGRSRAAQTLAAAVIKLVALAAKFA